MYFTVGILLKLNFKEKNIHFPPLSFTPSGKLLSCIFGAKFAKDFFFISLNLNEKLIEQLKDKSHQTLKLFTMTFSCHNILFL